MIQFVTGNLLDAKVDALVSTVSTAGVMGKGLALQFKKAFPANYKAYEAAAKRAEVQIGQMFVFDAGGMADAGSHVVVTGMSGDLVSVRDYAGGALDEFSRHVGNLCGDLSMPTCSFGF